MDNVTVWVLVIPLAVVLLVCGGAFATLDTVSERVDGPPVHVAPRLVVTSHRPTRCRARHRPRRRRRLRAGVAPLRASND